MSSTIKQAILSLKSRIADAYTAIVAKGGTLPATQDSANLPTAIASIPSGGNKPIIQNANYLFSGMTAPVYENNVDVSLAQDFSYCFYNYNGTEIDVTSWDTSKATSFNSLFRSGVIERIKGLESFDTSYVANMTLCFYWANNLKELDLRSWDLTNVTNVSDIFYLAVGTNKLASIRVGQGWVKGVDLTRPVLGHDALVQLFNDLPTISTSQTLTIGSAKQALLSAAELAIATSKGWQIA